jgi:predicted kinase
MSMLVLVSGIPGTGRSTIAEGIANALAIPVFNKDQVEASLWRSGITADNDSWQVAEDLLATHARLAHDPDRRARPVQRHRRRG